MRLVENHGVEHIAYCDYGEAVVGVAVPPGAARVGERVRIGIDAARVHLLRSDTARIAARMEGSHVAAPERALS